MPGIRTRTEEVGYLCVRNHWKGCVVHTMINDLYFKELEAACNVILFKMKTLRSGKLHDPLKGLSLFKNSYSI